MKKRLLTGRSIAGVSILGAVILAFAATRLHSQTDFAPWVPLHLTRQILWYHPDGSVVPNRIYDEIYQFADGSTARKSTSNQDPGGTFEITIAPTRHAMNIDLATGKAHAWEYHGGKLTDPRRRRCAENIHSQFEKTDEGDRARPRAGPRYGEDHGRGQVRR